MWSVAVDGADWKEEGTRLLSDILTMLSSEESICKERGRSSRRGKARRRREERRLL